jgi:hypothetical protein
MHVRTLTSTDITHEAIRLIETYGWVQRQYECEDGFCLVGAMQKSLLIHLDLYPDARNEVIEAFHDAMNRIYNITPVPARFNDANGRTREEVLGVLRDSIRG